MFYVCTDIRTKLCRYVLNALKNETQPPVRLRLIIVLAEYISTLDRRLIGKLTHLRDM